MGRYDDEDDDDLFEELDDYDYTHKTGFYEEDEEDEEDEDLETELILAGLDLDELSEMSEDDRREAIEDAGLDPDDFDDLFF